MLAKVKTNYIVLIMALMILVPTLSMADPYRENGRIARNERVVNPVVRHAPAYRRVVNPCPAPYRNWYHRSPFYWRAYEPRVIVRYPHWYNFWGLGINYRDGHWGGRIWIR